LNIESTWIGSKYAINTISGTSMASPHVCGLLAYFLSLMPKSDSGYFTQTKPAHLKKSIIKIASQGVLSDIPSDTPNLIIYNGGGSGNISEIFDGEPYVGDYNAHSHSEGLGGLADKALSEAEAFLEKAETEAMGEIKAAFEKAKLALGRNAA
jgi:cerevisin